MRPIPRVTSALALAALLAACRSENDGIIACTRVLETALVVTVTDSVTGAPLAAGATGHAVVGGQAIPLQAPGTGDRLRADGPAGTYSVVVLRPNYRPWARSEVRVRGDRCGTPTEPAQLHARLQPAGTIAGGAR